MKHVEFRERFDANLKELFWLEETIFGLSQKQRFHAESRIKQLQRQNQELDTRYRKEMEVDEPARYKALKTHKIL